MRDGEITRVATYCEQKLDLASIKLGEEYFYQSLPLCVIDAVFSIGVRYRGVQNAVRRYCEKFQIQQYRNYRDDYPPTVEQKSIQKFLGELAGLSGDSLTKTIFGNRQKNSPRGGILKAEAVIKSASTLQEFNVNHFQDVPILLAEADENSLEEFEKEIQKIPDQDSGISTSYFFMLAGSDDLIKPDQMVMTFLGNALGRPAKSIGLKEAQELVSGAAQELRPSHPDINARLLDYGIWSFQRQQPKGV